MAYEPIQDYGIIGDLSTAALVSRKGSIDWFCLPRFDSPSVFAALLDENKGGRFLIGSETEGITYKQFYWPDSNVLVTRLLSPSGVGEITDFMPVTDGPDHPDKHRLVRIVSAVRGTMRIRVECRPAFNYGRDAHEVKLFPSGVVFHSSGLSLHLATRVALTQDGRGGVAGDFELGAGETCVFVLQRANPGEDQLQASDAAEARILFEETVGYWREWLSQCTYKGRWREMVHRSALVLKLLTYEPTGAIVAAPTCSLPESIGGVRNWDYRYTWIRDAVFTLYALMRIGFTREAARFMNWMEARCHELEPDGSLQIMYGIDGRHNLAEETFDHLAGYRNSKPVRIGNAACTQHQLDIYGELLDSIYLYNKYGSPISYELWEDVRKLLDWVCQNWLAKDHGIWEVRGQPQNFVYSKVMCWVALDRGLRLANKRSFPGDLDIWLKNRDAIYEEIQKSGWSAERQAFTQFYGSGSLDAANLILPLVFFISPTDPRMIKTLEAIRRPPDQGGLLSDSMVYRYNPQSHIDGLEGGEGSFNMCTFWLVEALTRAGRHNRRLLEDAQLLFEKMLGFANHLGLYSEQTGNCGEALGNFPQALTHLAMISAAYNLDRALDAQDSEYPGLPGKPSR
jgi:GH15 family glucan-1,4-alpha-glucosidase